jgi:acetate kinase
VAVAVSGGPKGGDQVFRHVVRGKSLKILALNSGSSSLKFQVVEIAGGRDDECLELVRGHITIGRPAQLQVRAAVGQIVKQELAITKPAEAVSHLVHWLKEHTIEHPDAVGHRVVHGGEEFTRPTKIGEFEINKLERIGQLAPLHNAPALDVIRETSRILGDSVPMVATFDTAFHQTLPEHARRYAIPEELTIKHRLWRYGFHGLAHRWMMQRYAAIAKRPTTSPKLLTFQLGSGCSAAAIRNGRSIETSMGLTPLEGLVMATRSGDLDPSLPGWLAQQERLTIEQVLEGLNKGSGLLGLHGSIRDVRHLLEAEQNGDGRAALALDMFCHRARKYLGAYLAILDGADAILFGGGVGENQPAIRQRICGQMHWCGLRLNQERNEGAAGQEACISADDSAISVYVIPVNEEVLIARDTFECLRSNGAST